MPRRGPARRNSTSRGSDPRKGLSLFDEIQEVQEWEKCVNSLRVALDCDIYITGSNAKLLSGELATYLGGRYVEFVIYPFSFAEFLELYRTIAPEASGQQAFQKYLLAGGMPYLANLRYAEEPSRQYLTDVFNSVQLKDVVKRNMVRDVDLLERILAYVMANVGTTFLRVLSLPFSEERAEECRAGDDPELSQILLRRLSVLSGQAAGPAGQAGPFHK